MAEQNLAVQIKRNVIAVTIGGRGAKGDDGDPTQDIDGGTVRNSEMSGNTDTEETHAPVGDGTVTMDPTKPAQFIDLTGLTDANAITIAIDAGTPAGRGRYGIVIEIQTGAVSVPAITWPGNLKTTPTVDTASKVYLIGIQTRDDGATWRVVEDGGSDA